MARFTQNGNLAWKRLIQKKSVFFGKAHRVEVLRFGVFTLVLVLAAARASANPFLGDSDIVQPAAPSVTSGSAALAAAQLTFRDRVAAALSVFNESANAGERAAALFTVIAGAFVYGILHAAGPGHRKTVLFSLFLQRRAKLWEPLAAGLLSATVHASVGVLLVALISLATGAVASLGSLESARVWLEGGTFVILGLVAALLAIRPIIKIVTTRKTKTISNASDEINEGSTTRKNRGRLYAIAAMTSLVPCPGATMLLLFAMYIDQTPLGIIGVIAMSFGMALVIAAAGYMAYFGRNGLFYRLKTRQALIEFVTTLLELVSYLVMLIFALWAAWPFLRSLVS